MLIKQHKLMYSYYVIYLISISFKRDGHYLHINFVKKLLLGLAIRMKRFYLISAFV